MLTGVLEGLLFVVGEDGMTIKKMEQLLSIEEKQVIDILKQLEDKYKKEDSGITLVKFGEYYKLATKKEHKKYYEALVESGDDSLLSQSSLEVLAIIAYNQPVTRLMVEEIRGIGSSHIIRRLISKNLIEAVGRADTAGKPILYAVTKDFLDYFGLESVDSLPKLEEIEVENEETDLYESKYREIDDKID